MKISFTQNYFDINNGYLSHNGGLGSQYSSLKRGEFVDYDEFMMSSHSLEGMHASGISVGMQNSQAMLDEDFDNSKSIMPVSDNDRMYLTQKVNVQSSGIVRENITSLKGVVVHPATYMYANGKRVKIYNLEELNKSELADAAMIHGRSWVAGNGYALDTYDPYFLDFYEGGRDTVDPSKRESTLFMGVVVVPFSVILFLLAANNASVWLILLAAVILGCIGVSYIRYEINADHEKNRKFTMEMIIHYLNKDKSTVFDLGNQVADTLDYNTDDSDITKMGFDAENNLSEENASDEFYSYCPMCYAARIENETTCICCGASLKQSS